MNFHSVALQTAFYNCLINSAEVVSLVDGRMHDKSE